MADTGGDVELSTSSFSLISYSEDTITIYGHHRDLGLRKVGDSLKISARASSIPKGRSTIYA